MGIVRILPAPMRRAQHRRVRTNNGFPFHASGTWGFYERRLSGHGLVVEHLRVLPPDGRPEERLVWNAAVIWPYVGFFCGIAAAAAAHHTSSVAGSVTLGAVVWLVPWAWLAWRSRPFARRVRESWRISGAGTWMVDPSPLRDHAERLADAGRRAAFDRTHRHVTLTWGDVYAALAAQAEPASTALVVHTPAAEPRGVHESRHPRPRPAAHFLPRGTGLTSSGATPRSDRAPHPTPTANPAN